MSDRSSESSGEWVLLSENDEDLLLENIEQSLNLEISCDAVHSAVLDSIRSSLSSEELEWQYEQLEDCVLPYGPSHIENIDRIEFVENTSDSSANQDNDGDISGTPFINKFEVDVSSDLSSFKNIHSYKHQRNEELNFILNVMLVLALSSAIGLGIGHFLGWSNKCYKSAAEIKKAAVPDNFPGVLAIRQNLEDVIHEPERQTMGPDPLPENLSGSISCLNSKEGSISTHLEILHNNNNIATHSNLPENCIHMSSDALELKNEEIIQNVSDFGFLHGPSIITQLDWNKNSNHDASFKKEFSGTHIVSSVKNNDNLFYKNDVSNVEFELPKDFYIKDKNSFLGDFFNPEEESSVNVNNLPHKDELNDFETEFHKQFFVKDKSSDTKGNLTNQLRKNLNQVIQSLKALAITRFSDFNQKYTTSVADSELVLKLYNDFQSLINSKITDIDNFVLSAEYKVNEKFSIKYLQKMVYSLVDSVDYLLKVSFKSFGKFNKKLNVYKLSADISKVIFNFNKKWDKNNRVWAETVAKSKLHGFQEWSLKMGNKQRRKNDQFGNKNYRKNKFRRYSMKS